MSITRVQLRFETNYTQIPNDWARDHRLSLKARGLLLEIMSHSINWNVTVDSLIRNGKEGRDSVRAGLKELAELGYLTRVYPQTDGGKLAGSHYVVSDPFDLTEGRVFRPSVQPTVGEPTHKEDQLTSENHLTSENDPPSSSSVEPTLEQRAEVEKELRRFLDVYPKVSNVRTTTAAFLVALTKASAEQIITGARGYARLCKQEERELRYISQPVTWLNEQRWNDTYPGPATSKKNWAYQAGQ